jgi:hypothetical protein
LFASIAALTPASETRDEEPVHDGHRVAFAVDGRKSVPL